MGLDSMRVGGGRCPPLFVGGLLLACLLLVYNWWSLSTENLELLRQIDGLNEVLKISAEERTQCITLRENVEQRYKQLEDEVGTLHVRMLQLDDLKKVNDKLSESVTMCKSELDSLNTVDATKSATLETLRLEMETITTQLDAKKDENQKLKEDLQTAQNDIEKLKLTINSQPKEKKDTPNEVPLQSPTADPNKVENSADADVKEEDDNAAEANASGLENRFNAPDEPFDPKAGGEQP